MRRLTRWAAAALATAWIPLVAQAQDLDEINRELVDMHGEAQRAANNPLRKERLRSATFVEERLADGQLYYELKDYTRASIIFSDIVDNYPNHRAHPDALYWLGESLYQAGDVYGARTSFGKLLERAENERFRPYAQRALNRVVDIALHTRDFEGVDEAFRALDRAQSGGLKGATAYARAKYLYNRAVPTDAIMRRSEDPSELPAADTAGLDQAQAGFEAVPADSRYTVRARYFNGVIHTLRGQYPRAIQLFKGVVESAATSAEEREAQDLARLALARLYYETDRLADSVQTYQSVERGSEHYATSLYERAWAHLRLGDSSRAERALDMLEATYPDSHYIPDAKVLRGNLLLRDGRFEPAEEEFREVRLQFGPVRRELEGLAEEHPDLAGYFQELVSQNMEQFDRDLFLPAAAAKWTRTEGDVDRAFEVLEDYATAKSALRQTQHLVSRLEHALAGDNAVGVFPDLRRARERTTALRNRLARVRRKLIAAEAEALPDASGELAEVRRERLRIERLIGGMPSTDEDFAVRDEQMEGRYRDLERQLSQLEVELTGMEARLVAMERYRADTQPAGTAADTEALHREIAQQRTAVAAYREQIEAVEDQIEVARAHVGVGDARYQRDARLREEYNGLVRRERALMAAAGVRLPPELDRLHARAAAVEALLNRRDSVIGQVLSDRVAEIEEVVQEEKQKIAEYQQEIAALEPETEITVALAALDSFNNARQRFYDLILNADVGRIDVAWARREEHRTRVDMLTRERTRDLQALDDEFREIMDDTQPEGVE